MLFAVISLYEISNMADKFSWGMSGVGVITWKLTQLLHLFQQSLGNMQ